MITSDVKPAASDPAALLSATRRQESFAAVLAMIAGFADAYAYIEYRTYVSFMSGNTTTVGSMTGVGNYAAVVPALVAIVSYVVGVFCGVLLAHAGLHRPHRLVFGSSAALLAIVVVLMQLNLGASVFSIALISLAMGAINTTQSRVGAQSLNLVFVTGTLSRMATNFALAVAHAPLPDAQGPWDNYLRRALLLLGVWASFLLGALVGGFTTSHFGAVVLLLPALSLLVLTVSDRS